MPHPDPSALQALLGPHAWPCRRGSAGARGVALPPFIDHHVHLHLLDESQLARGGIAGVVDLGGDPRALAQRPPGGMPHVEYAGAFLTAAGGYPSGRSWAPPGIVREVVSASADPGAPGGARTAVDEQAEFGASVIKVALNASSGPVLDDVVLAAIVAAAHARGLPVVAHVQGGDTAERAIRARVDVLAHTPFTAALAEADVERAAASQAWITTLDIHRDDARSRAVAVSNLRAFAAAGGRVLYGTDLGNGDLPVGVNRGEIAALREAGMSAAAIIQALVDPWPVAGGAVGVVSAAGRAVSTAGRGVSAAGRRVEATGRGVEWGVSTFVPGAPPQSDDGLSAWLARATVVPAEELIHDDL